MEKLSYNSYPDSAGSSPRSREIDFENPPPWEEQQSYKAKFMCSYGGKIQPRPHDNQLAYVGGETKILSVDRGIKLSDMIAKLYALSGGGTSGGEYYGVSFKYQLPGEELDALISVTNDDDLEHMMHEYDRVQRGSAKPARMRLFLFPVTSPAGGFGSESAVRTEPERFVGALNTAAACTGTEKPIAAGSSNADFLFGLEKAIPPPPSPTPPPPPPPPPQVHGGPPYVMAGVDERDIRSDHGMNPVEMQNQLREFQRLQIVDQEPQHYQAINVMEAGGYYQKFQENRPVASVQHAPPAMAGYWPEKPVSGGTFQAPTTGFSEQQVYVLPCDAQGNLYHAPPHAPVRSVTGQTGQAYYNINVHQRVAPDVYRDQPVYGNAVNPTAQGVAPAEAGSAAAAFLAGPSPVRHVAEQMYSHVAYDAGSGRQVYYTAPVGGVVVPSQVHPYDGGGGGGGGVVVSQEGRVVSGVGSRGASSSN